MKRKCNLLYNRRFWLGILLVLSLLVVSLCFLFPAWADTGNSVSHNSSSSDDSGDLGLFYLLLHLVIDYPVIGIPLLILVLVFRKPIKRWLKAKKDEQMGDVNTYFKTINKEPETNLDALKTQDPGFSEPQFITMVNNMYLQLQDAWMKKEWQPIRAFETDELFNMHARQLQRYIDAGQTNVVENICILDTSIIRYDQDAVNDILTVKLRVRLNDYVIDDKTRQVIAGNPKQDIYMTYHWQLIRRKGVQTRVNNAANHVTQCPNCGANVSINASGECEYCGSIISNGMYNWVLYSIQTINQY